MTQERSPLGYIPEDINPDNLRTLTDLLDMSTANGQGAAFTCMGQSMSFGELKTRIDAFAAHLTHDTNLQPGDRIAIQLPNILHYPIALYGASKAGLIVVNTNPLYQSSEMRHQFIDAGVKAIVIYQGMAHKLQEIIHETNIESVYLARVTDFHPPAKRHLMNFVIKYVKKLEPAFSLPGAKQFRDIIHRNLNRDYTPVEANPEDTAILQYTGGTTGVAKGAMLTHANLISNVLQTLNTIENLQGPWHKLSITPLPLYHIYAFTLSQIILYKGGHTILIPNPRDIKGFIKELKNWKFTNFMGLNTLFVALMSDEGFSHLDFSHLLLTSSGGMALASNTAKRWHDITGCHITEGYGLTETSPVVSINNPTDVRIGSIGQKIPYTTVKLIDESGAPAPEGEPGELCVKGPQVMRGYWLQNQENDSAFTDDGYFKTGDIATISADNYITIVDRAKDMINVSGFNVYPNEIERIISTHQRILECAAIGIPDHSTGEAVKLFVIKADANLTEDDIREWCKQELTGYKRPKYIEFVTELPKSNVGKVLRRELREIDQAKHNQTKA